MLLGNTSVPASCRVKLLDFGLARLLTEADGVTISDGNVAGTPAYMSPEQCEGRSDLDGRSDVYGLGALLFEMICGRTPFVGPPPRMMYQHVYESVPSPEKFRPELAPEIGLLIQKMLAKSREGRPTMSEAAAQLRRLSAGAATPPPLPLVPSGISDKARLWIGILSLINVALIASLWRARYPGSGGVPAGTPAQVLAPLTARPAEPASAPRLLPDASGAASSLRPEVSPQKPPELLPPGPKNGEAAPPAAIPTKKAAPAVVRSPQSVPKSTNAGSQTPERRPARMPAKTVAAGAKDAGASPAAPPHAEQVPPPAPPSPSVTAPAPAPAPSSPRSKVEYWK